MKYRCAECHRSLIKPAYTAPESMGGWVLGRVCAEKAGKARPKKRRKCQIQQATAHAGQLDMFVILEREYLVELATAPGRGDDEDDPLAAVPIIQRLTSAAEAAPMLPRGPVSVFDMARAPVTLAPTRAQEARALTRIERTDAGVRCIRILPQETAEWQIKEAARRARQTPPKPTKGVKTMGQKMAGMLGMEPVSDGYVARVSVASSKQALPSKAEQARAQREQRERPARVRRGKD